MIAAFAKNGMKLSFTPCSFSTLTLMRSRSATSALMSISLNVVRCAVECCATSRFSAMRLRRVDIFSRVSRGTADGGRRTAAGGETEGGVAAEAAGFAGDGAGEAGAAGVAGAAGATGSTGTSGASETTRTTGPDIAARTSGLLTTPPRAVPAMLVRSIPNSTERRRAAGIAAAGTARAAGGDGAAGGVGGIGVIRATGTAGEIRVTGAAGVNTTGRATDAACAVGAVGPGGA